MSVLDKASLIQIPSGYKEGKLYSVKPTPTYGSELVTTLDFNSGWGVSNVTINDFNSFTTTTSFGYIRLNSILTVGKTYILKIQGTTTSTGTNAFNIRRYNGSFFYKTGIKGTFNETFTFTALDEGIMLSNEGLATTVIDNLSVKEVLIDGDLNFTRASSATRVNSDGFIEDVPWNKLQQSNTFSTTWVVVSGASVTSGQSGYDGTNNAWLLEKTAANKYIQQQLTFVGTNTFSVYIKANTTNWVALMRGDGQKAFFNLSGSGSTGSVVNGISSNIESISNGWFRCSFTFENSSTNYARIYPADGNNDTSGTSGSIYIQDAQLNKGTTAKTYFPTTDRLNVPRIDYTGGGCGKLLLEPQRTNLITQSEDFSNAYWSKSSITVTDGFTSPSGNLDATLLKGSTNSSVHNVVRASLSASNTAALSIFAKAKELRYLQIASANTPNQCVNFDLQDGLIGTVGSSFSNAKIENYGNGWYKCSVTSINQYNGMYISLVSSLTSSWLESWTMSNNTDGLFIYGAQLEQGDFASSYIPTSGATATRVADVCNGAGTSATFNSTEGVLFAETKASVHNGNITLSNGGNNDNLIISFNLNSGRIDCNMKVGGAYQFIFNYTTDMSINHKIAVRYKTNDFALFVDGTKVLTDTSGITPTANTLNELNFSSANQAANFFYGNTKQLMTFNTALTDAELETLTTL